jgi:hypothetical protein
MIETRQDELIEEILTILRPQLDGQQTLSAAQCRELQIAISNYTEGIGRNAA